MVPHGITPADDWMAARIWGWTLRHWRRTRRWERIPGLVLLREAGVRRGRLFAEEQLLAAHAAEERAAACGTPPVYNLPPVPGIGEADREAHPDDLLDLEEARLALPPERRVAWSTWKTYRYGDKTRLPDPDVEVGGTELWYRRTIVEWDATRPGRRGSPTSGRPVGSTSREPDGGNRTGNARRQKVRLLLAANPHLTGRDLAEALGVHPGYAEQLLRPARVEKVARRLAQDPDLTVEDVQELFGLAVRAHAQNLLTAARTGT